LGNLNPGATQVVRVQNFPILDSLSGDASDGVINFLDVQVASTADAVVTNIDALTIFQVSEGDGLVTLTNSDNAVPITAGTAFTLTYVAADVQTHTVKITSSQDNVGFDLTVLETGAATGKFEATFKTDDATLSVIDLTGGVEEALYNLDFDGSGTIDNTSAVTTTEVALGQDLNGDGDATDAGDVTIIDIKSLPNFSVRPTIGAVSGAKVTVTYDDGGTARLTSSVVETTEPVVTLTQPSDSYSTSEENTVLKATITDSDSGVDEGSIVFAVREVNDQGAFVRNIGTNVIVTTSMPAGFQAEVRIDATEIDQQETTLKWTVTASDAAGNETTADEFDLKIDTRAPDLAQSITVGQRELPVAAITGHVLNSDRDGVTTDASNRTTVRMVFAEALDGLTADGGSIDATDFEVNDAPPFAVDWSSDVPESVFLTVPELPADSRPKVEFVGEVNDRAGNTQRSTLAIAEAADGISPTVTASVSATLDTSDVTLTILVDETLLTTPVVTVTDADGADVTGVLAQLKVDPANVNRFTATFDPAATPMAFTITVTATDTSANATTEGDAVFADGDITFEIDDAIPDPAIDVGAKDPNVFTQNPFIEIDWTGEASEYTGDGHGFVDITAITLNGDDISADLNREADGKFVLALTGLAFQEHVLLVTGVDDAGNKKADFEKKFTVKVRADFDIPMTPGWNLISFPGEPTDNDINAVISATQPIDQVLTYDPSAAGGWLVAVRGDDGLLGGTLSTMSADRAYWVHSTSFEGLSVSIPAAQGGTATLLPTINLVAGWNLVPILDVTGELAAGATIGGVGGDIASYVKGVAQPSRVYKYLPREDRFETAGDVEVGAGYWMYMPSAGILVP